MTVASRLEARRRALGYNQTQLAELVTVRVRELESSTRLIRQSDVSTWERGTLPSTKTLPALADVLGVSVDWLLRGEAAA